MLPLALTHDLCLIEVRAEEVHRGHSPGGEVRWLATSGGAAPGLIACLAGAVILAWLDPLPSRGCCSGLIPSPA